MKMNLTRKILILTVLFGSLTLTSHSSMAASDNAALSLDWRIALPAELPEPVQVMASLNQ